MRVFHHVYGLRDVLKVERQTGKSIAFVPTMGNLHDAHLALVKQAQAAADIVVASIFVNRLQFGLNEDWDKYPRTLDADKLKLSEVGCDLLFCPDEAEMYPNGMETQTKVIVPSMAEVLCGASRPGHFEGVTTVVSKLFNIVQPDCAVFGTKDYQQLAIIRRMVEDLCMPVRVLAGDIVREQDGLAMSSRNSFITNQERPKANQLYRSLCSARDELLAGARDYSAIEWRAKAEIEKQGFRVDYFVISNSKSLEPAAHDDLEITILGAMYTAGARLIDNLSLSLKP